MAVAPSSLSSSFSALSISSSPSDSNSLFLRGTPLRVSLPQTKAPLLSLKRSSSTPLLRCTPVVSAVASAEGLELQAYVKSRLPGGFAAQSIIGTGRRKCAIARVVLQEGTGKFIINYRDAKFWKMA